MSAPGLYNGLRILEYINNNKKVSFTELATELEINKGSLSRFLKVLCETGYVKKDKQQYILGSKLEIFRKEYEWEHIIYPLLTKISSKTNCSTIWIEYRHGKLVCLERIINPMGITMQEIGTVGTYYLVNPSGYILLGESTPKVQTYLINQASYNEQQKKYIPDDKTVQYFLKMYKKNNYMDDEAKIYPGIRRIGIPVYDKSKKLIACIVLGTIDQVVSDDVIKNNIKIAKKCLAETIEE